MPKLVILRIIVWNQLLFLLAVQIKFDLCPFFSLLLVLSSYPSNLTWSARTIIRPWKDKQRFFPIFMDSTVVERSWQFMASFSVWPNQILDERLGGDVLTLVNIRLGQHSLEELLLWLEVLKWYLNQSVTEWSILKLGFALIRMEIYGTIMKYDTTGWNKYFVRPESRI